MTQSVIQKCNENSYRSMPAKLYIQIASSWPKPGQVVQLNRRNPADHHSPCADCVLGTRDPGPIYHRGAIFAFCTNSINCTSEKEKLEKKHSFSDGKCFTDFVLLRCFIDFQTTLVDSRNLVIFSTFW
jgi:hypothetical protein